MSTGLWLALGAMLLLGLADLVYQRGAAAGVPAHHFLMLQGWFFLPGAMAYGLATGTLVPAPYMLWGMVAGIFVFGSLYNFARALAAGSISVVAPIFRLSFTVTVVLAVVWLGEPLGGWKVGGLAAALLAVWLLLGGEARGGRAAAANRVALTRAVAAMAAMGVANFLYKLGALQGGLPATFVTGQALVFTPLATLFVWRMEGRIRPPRGAWRYGAAVAALMVVALVMLFASLAHGDASVLVPITQMGFVVTAAVGVVLLREPLTPRKGAGIACAVAALACLAKS